MKFNFLFKEDGGEKLIHKKEKALRAREEELRRNLKELGEDVAAITASAPSEPTTSVPSVEPVPETASPQRKKKGKVDKHLRVKLWNSKGLRSKENAEPVRKEEKTEEAGVNHVGKNSSPSRATLPDDISHLFTPHTAGVSKSGARAHVRAGQKTAGAVQHLELINGKRFISIGSSPDSLRRTSANNSAPAADDSAVNKRVLPSPGLQSPRHSPKRAKLLSAPRLSAPSGFGLYSSEQFTNFVSYAYHGLLHVFRYLTVQELMAAAGVCKLWRDLALHHSHVISSPLNNNNKHYYVIQ